MEPNRPAGRGPLPAVLTVLLFVVLFLGPGPGLHLVNPGPEDSAADRTVLGLPVVYAWGLLWFVAQAILLLVSYFCVWSRAEEEK